MVEKRIERMHRNKRPKIEEAEAVTTNSKFSNDVVSKVVEFKFEACETVCVLEAEVRIDGVMHIPLLQCQETGYFRIMSLLLSSASTCSSRGSTFPPPD